MNILLVGWNRLGKKKKSNWNHEFFRRELARQHNVVFFGSGYGEYDGNLQGILKKHPETDIVLVHFEHRARALARGLDQIKDISKVHIMGGDYDKRCFNGYNKHFNKINYDIIFFRYALQEKRLKENSIGGIHYLLPWSVNTDLYYNYELEKTIDVMSSFHTSNIHPYRYNILNIVYKMDVTSYLKPIYFEEYIKKINESKMFITSNVFERELSGKYYEVMACGTLLLTTEPDDLNKLGFYNNEHLIIYKDDFSDLQDKIEYFLKHDKEREEIAKNGMDMVRNRHSHKVRVKEFTSIVEAEIG